MKLTQMSAGHIAVSKQLFPSLPSLPTARLLLLPRDMQSAEDQTRCWMWAARRKLLASFLLPSSSTPAFETWEEQAFARDSAAGDLVGYAWPPRSYSCSFCRREFRSAQALGGHMNVHRRDRARLKQASSPAAEPHDEDPRPLDPLSPATCNPNPNPNSMRLELGREVWRSGEGGHSKKLKTDDLSFSLSHSPAEELDLELRLGDSPKMKQRQGVILIE